MLRKTIWCHGIRSRECFVHFHRTIAIEANKSKMKNLFFGSFSFGHSFWWENRKCVWYRSLKSSLIPISPGKKCLDKVSSGTFTSQYNCCVSCFLFFCPTISNRFASLPVYYTGPKMKAQQNKCWELVWKGFEQNYKQTETFNKTFPTSHSPLWWFRLR